MKRRICALLCLVCLLLSGCSWMGGSYVNVTPHTERGGSMTVPNRSASNFAELVAVMEEIVSEASPSGLIYMPGYSAEEVRQHIEVVSEYIRSAYPLGAYAVEDITYQVGTSAGRRAVAVDITYRRGYMEIQKVRKAANMEEAKAIIGEALNTVESHLVMQVGVYEETDFDQMVHDYAETYPDKVMEVPRVTYETYGSGVARAVELSFSYENSREDLRQMQAQVQPIFEAAAMYVSGIGTDYLKLSQLYTFLMKRFDYKMETSLTPAYSLLQHGVGDSRAIAEVYAAMCRLAGLECMVITGTRDGEPRTWNIVKNKGRYAHVDLLLCDRIGIYHEYCDGDMVGYIWDYSAYPKCYPFGKIPEETEPEETEPEETEPEETEPDETEPEETEPTEPTEPSQPSWPPVIPTEPTEPTEPEEPTDATRPTEPKEPTVPTEPTGSTDPTEPTEPTEPDIPITEPTESGSTEPEESLPEK